MEKEKVLEIKIVKMNDEWSSCCITHQNEEVLKRGKFKDEELNVYSLVYPHFYSIELNFCLRGDDPEKDSMPFVVENKNVDYLINLVNKINEKYRKKKRWRTEKGQKYYYVTNCLNVSGAKDFYDRLDTKGYESGNYFQTEEEAREYADKIRKLLQERE